jgi:tetratricopeptide (TPR) repeat protein
MIQRIVVCGMVLAGMVAMTQPLGVREGRWWKIAVSLPLIWTIFAQLSAGLGFLSGIAAILALVLLGFIWSGIVAHYMSDSLVRLLQGDASFSAGHIANFKYARAKIEDGDYPEAIKLTLHELEKKPDNYEGLILLAQLYFETHRPDEALKQIECILQNPDTTAEQLERPAAAKTECLNELNRLGIQPT